MFLTSVKKTVNSPANISSTFLYGQGDVGGVCRVFVLKCTCASLKVTKKGEKGRMSRTKQTHTSSL